MNGMRGKKRRRKNDRASFFGRTRKGSPGTSTPRGKINELALGGFEELLELLRAHTLLGIGAPLDAGRADRAGVQMTALLALGLGFIAPDLDLLAALLAPDVLGLGLADFYASWASFFKHRTILHLSRGNIYDAYHTK